MWIKWYKSIDNFVRFRCATQTCNMQIQICSDNNFFFRNISVYVCCLWWTIKNLLFLSECSLLLGLFSFNSIVPFTGLRTLHTKYEHHNSASGISISWRMITPISIRHNFSSIPKFFFIKRYWWKLIVRIQCIWYANWYRNYSRHLSQSICSLQWIYSSPLIIYWIVELKGKYSAWNSSKFGRFPLRLNKIAIQKYFNDKNSIHIYSNNISKGKLQNLFWKLMIFWMKTRAFNFSSIEFKRNLVGASGFNIFDSFLIILFKS